MPSDPFVFEVTYNTEARKEKYTLEIRAENIRDACSKLGNKLKILECSNITIREKGRLSVIIGKKKKKGV